MRVCGPSGRTAWSPFFMAIPATAQVLEIRLLSLQDWLIALALTAVSIGWRALGTGRLSGGTSARRPRG